MTLPPLRDAILYWTIAIVHDDNFMGWPVKGEPGEVFVSSKGYASARTWAQFRNPRDAELFLEGNRDVLERRYGNKPGFRGFRVCSATSFWPVDFDEPVQLTRRRPPRAEQHRG